MNFCAIDLSSHLFADQRKCVCVFKYEDTKKSHRIMTKRTKTASTYNAIHIHIQKEPFSVLGLVINVCHSSFIDLTQVCSFNVFSIFVSIFFIFWVFIESIRFYRLKSIANMSNRNDVSNKKTNRFIDVSIENALVKASISMFFRKSASLMRIRHGNQIQLIQFNLDQVVSIQSNF